MAEMEDENEVRVLITGFGVNMGLSVPLFDS
jgi:hypothetical protein